MKKRWETVWKNFCPDPAARMKYNTKAMGILMAFHGWAQKNSGIPIEIDRDYIINFGDNQLKGSLCIVRQAKDDKIDMLAPKYWTRAVDDFRIETDMEYITSFMAFKSMYGVDLNGCTLLLLKDMKEISVAREEEMYDRAVKTINAICSSIESELWYPRWNIHCSNCCYKEFCMKWR